MRRKWVCKRTGIQFINCSCTSCTLVCPALQGGKTFCASFSECLFAGSRQVFLCVNCVCLSLREFWLRLNHSRPQCLGVWECFRKLWELCDGVAKIWLFGPHRECSLIQPKLFASFISTSSRKSYAALCCFGIRTEEIQLTALKNFQVSKALVVAAEKIPLNVPNHRFETWSLHMLDSWLNSSVDYFTRR